ncbi:MAG: S9 family peptidase [Longimicrobiales bacterium]
MSRSRLPLVLTACLLTPAGALAQRPMTIVDLIETPTLSDPQLSPAGQFVAYTRREADWKRNRTVSHIWRVGADGQGAVQFTNGEDGEESPRWSPDGSRLAFLAERGDSATVQVWVIDNAGGEARRLTDHATEVSDFEWSPDGRWIYFTAADEKSTAEKEREKLKDDVYAFDGEYQHRHLWRISIADAGEERLTDGAFTVLGFEPFPDGSGIAHVRSPSPLLDDGPRAELWVMDSDGGSVRQLTSNNIRETTPRLSPDGDEILFIANGNEDFDFYYNDKVFSMPLSGGEPELLVPGFEEEVLDAAWSADGREVFILANTGLRQELFRVSRATGEVEQVTRGDHVVDDWGYDAGSGRHVFVLRSPHDPGDVWALRAGAGEGAGSGGSELTRLTHVFDEIERRYRLPRVEAIQWEGEDGVEVEGLLFYPLDYNVDQRYPLVVQTHGGPAASDKFGWHSSSDYVPVLASLGYFVLQPNYRGSTGYGDEFLRDMVGHYFNQAHKDVMAGVDALIGRGLVDGERMAKMGWSAGGHMTNKIITYTDRFKAASSGAGAVDWLSMYAQSDTRVYRTPWFGAPPWGEDAPVESYIAASPLFDIHKVTTPTLVLVGENDRRVPMAQSVELYRALEANGVPTKLYVAPRQGHGWRELRHRLFKANVELDWFERWVRGREYVWERSPMELPQAKAGAQAQAANPSGR